MRPVTFPVVFFHLPFSDGHSDAYVCGQCERVIVRHLTWFQDTAWLWSTNVSVRDGDKL